MAIRIPEIPPDEKVWAIVEIMGHVRISGILTEEEKFGSKLGRVDIPQLDGSFVTRYFGGSAVYQIHIVSEEAARHAAKINMPAPMSKWDFPKAIEVAVNTVDGDDEELRDDNGNRY